MQRPIVILGGGTGGVAAALAVADAGLSCVVTEPTGWVGGQLTAQAVPPDENRWIDGRDGVVSANATYLDYRNRVRAWYRAHGRLTAAAAADATLNPGAGWVSDLCHRPDVGHAVLIEILAEHVAAGRITVLLHHEPVAAVVHGDRIEAVECVDRRTGDRVTLSGELFLDATEVGEVLALAGAEHLLGAESTKRFGEMHGRDDGDDVTDQQAVSWCFAMEHRPGEDHTIGKPEGYDAWASYVPAMRDRPWTGPLFSWRIPDHEGTVGRVLPMVPWPDEPAGNQWELWRYRRIACAAYHEADAKVPDVSLVNWVQMDYFERPMLEPTASTVNAGLSTIHDPPSTSILERALPAKAMSRCLLHWMQTAAPRHDGGTGYPGLRLHGDYVGTADTPDAGFALHPYIREARRLLARTMITEAHVGVDQRIAEGKLPKRDKADESPAPGEAFADSVGIGHYRLDLHPSPAGRNSVYVRTCPFRVPMGALIPLRVTNLLAAGKALGVTHVTNGCYRLHPVEWAIGEAAGVLASHCLQERTAPAAVHARAESVAEAQQRLAGRGVPLAWPWE